MLPRSPKLTSTKATHQVNQLRSSGPNCARCVGTRDLQIGSLTTRVSINNGILEFQKYQLTSHLSFFYNTKRYVTTHAKIPWFKEDKQRGDTSECRQSQGKTIHHHCHHTSPTGAKQKFWCQRLVFRWLHVYP